MKIRFIILLVLFICLTEVHAFYNPSTGRWLNRDPAGETSSENLYTFVNNDSFDFIDLDGRDAMPTAMASSTTRFVMESTSPPRAISACGSSESTVKFRLDNARGLNGWIVQHVVAELHVKDCDGQPVPGKDGVLSYYEAWEVRDGDIYNGRATGGVNILHTGDHFVWPDYGSGTKGTARKTGYVAWLPNYSLPDWGADIPSATGLPSSYNAPSGWSDSGGTLFHWLQSEWSCCCGDYKKTIATGFPYW